MERAATILTQITFSLIVLQAFIRHNALWYVAAVLWHAVIDAVAVLLGGYGWGYWPIEGVVVVFGLVNAGILGYLIRHEPQEAPAPVPAAPSM